MKSLLAAAAALLLSHPGVVMSQSTPVTAEVEALLREHQHAWAASDMQAMFTPVTEDIEWVNIVGMHWRGRRDVQAAHEAYHESMFRGVPMRLEAIESLRELTADVIVVVARWSVGEFTTPAGHRRPASQNRMTLVMLRTRDGLRIAHVANIEIDAGAQAHDPIRKRGDGD